MFKIPFQIVLTFLIFLSANLVADCGKTKRGPPGRAGPEGPQGPIGPIGPNGPSIPITAYGNFYSTFSQIVISGDPVLFTFNGPILNTSSPGSGIITINLPGRYLVNYSVAILQLSGADQATFHLELNGTPIIGSFSNPTLVNQPGSSTADDNFLETLSININVPIAFSSLELIGTTPAGTITLRSPLNGVGANAILNLVRIGESS